MVSLVCVPGLFIVVCGLTGLCSRFIYSCMLSHWSVFQVYLLLYVVSLVCVPGLFIVVCMLSHWSVFKVYLLYVVSLVCVPGLSVVCGLTGLCSRFIYCCTGLCSSLSVVVCSLTG